MSGGCNRRALGEQPPQDPKAAQAVDVKDWESYRKFWTRAESRELLTQYPLHLDIELAGTCNLKCSMCWQSGALVAPLGVMDDHLFKSIINDGMKQGLCAVKLQSRGESLLHPRIGELARFAKDKGVLDLQLTTNATLFDKQGKIESILNSGIDKLIFSIDDEHDKSALKVYGEKTPNVRALFREIVTRRNQMVSARPIMRIQTFAPPGVSQTERLAQVKAEFPEADEYLVNVLWNSAYREESVEGLTRDHEFFPCAYLWTRLTVFWNGDVTTCCRDYNGTLALGNAKEHSIKSLWLGQQMTLFRHRHSAGRRQSMDICANCDISTRKKEIDRQQTFIWEKNDDKQY